ncbi:MAG: hypothetical protein PHP26_10380, partial [Syntrophomonas sp.]|nr:hypothetical protein [Syntrophomonas sp.]
IYYLFTEMPLHIHQAMASSETATSQAAAGKVWANSNQNPYGIGAPNVKANTAMGEYAWKNWRAGLQRHAQCCHLQRN